MDSIYYDDIFIYSSKNNSNSTTNNDDDILDYGYSYVIFFFMCIMAFRIIIEYVLYLERRHNIQFFTETTVDIYEPIIITIDYIDHMVIIDDIEEEEGCPICYDELNNENIVVIIKCGHIFHKNCINRWLNQNFSCPICRRNPSINL